MFNKIFFLLAIFIAPLIAMNELQKPKQFDEPESPKQWMNIDLELLAREVILLKSDCEAKKQFIQEQSHRYDIVWGDIEELARKRKATIGSHMGSPRTEDITYFILRPKTAYTASDIDALIERVKKIKAPFESRRNSQ